MKTPIVSRNRPDRLRAAIRSALDQTFAELEIIVVDDASTDETEKTLESLAQKREIRYLRNETRQGASRSRNIAIQEARGEFIAGLDDDDTWHPHRIEKLLNAFQEGVSAVCAYDMLVHENREIVWRKKPRI
ncbi:MAG: glycosyltransferase, partial [Bacteroidetes bacterium]|nr:glycosyltransferase [Bacteroidota bacterium]